MPVVWDTRLARAVVRAGEWVFFYGYLHDDRGKQLLEQFVWLRVNNKLTKGYISEFNKFRFYVKFRDPGIYILQPLLFSNRIISDGPRTLVVVLPYPNDMDKPYEVRYFKRICIEEIKPALRKVYAIIKRKYPHAKMYIRSGIVSKGYSYHDVDFLVEGVTQDEIKDIERTMMWYIPVNMDVWRYEEFKYPYPTPILPIEEVLK